MDIEFLEFEDVLEIHADQLARYGGQDGFIDQNVVASATEAPRASWNGQYLHGDIAGMAAAYLFGFAASQGFADGNKRTALATAVEFLARNGYDLKATNEEVYEVTIAVANHQMTREQVADWTRERLAPMS